MQQNHEIVTIGGGTGTPVVNEALLSAGKPYVNSIVTVMDSGGITGRMRTDSRGEEIAYSDGLRVLLSLIDPLEAPTKQVVALKRLLRSRNGQQQDLGYTIFSHLYSKQDGFQHIQKTLEDLTTIQFKGQVIPITLCSTHIHFRTKSGQNHEGEHELDGKRMSTDMVDEIWLSPQVPASPQALRSIGQAKFIIFPSGSLHGSILVNLLPAGVLEAYKDSKAKRILVTNLASARNETHEFTPENYIQVFQKYTQMDKPLDILVVPSIDRKTFEERYPQVAENYGYEHSHFLGWTPDELKSAEQEFGIQVVAHDATFIDPEKKRIRHDPTKLADTLGSIVKTF